MRKRNHSYRPVPVRKDTLQRVVTGLLPMATARDALLSFKIKNHAALVALVDGTATTDDVYVIGHAFITAQSLAVGGHGKDWVPELNAAQEAWTKIANRYNKWGKLQIMEGELEAVDLGMQVFDKQMDTCTIQQFELAVARARKAIATKSNLSKQICHQAETANKECK